MESTINKITLYTNEGGQTSELTNYYILNTIRGRLDSFELSKENNLISTNNSINVISEYLNNEGLTSSSSLSKEQYDELSSYYNEALSVVNNYVNKYGEKSDLNYSSMDLASSLLTKFEDSNNEPVVGTYVFNLEDENTNYPMRMSWDSYAERIITSGMLSTNTPEMIMNISSANFPASDHSINNCPVVKNATITIEFPNSTITNLTIKLKQWGTKSKSVVVSYYDPNSNNTSMVRVGTYEAFNSGYMNINLNSLPSKVNKIYIDCSSNTNQVGIANISATLSTKVKNVILNNYYASVSNTYIGETLWAKLSEVTTNTHSYDTTYSDLRYLTYLTDMDLANPNNVIDFYTKASIQGKWSIGGEIWTREHVWCSSHGWWTGPSERDRHAGTDLHHLRPENPSINSSRNNSLYGEVSHSSSEKLTFDINGVSYDWGWRQSGGVGVYEPLDSVKGDVARILMYMITRYKGEANSITSIVSASTDSAAYDLLLRWHKSDPVDASEIHRNQQIYLIQGNRNPFIDNPDYAPLIWENL